MKKTNKELKVISGVNVKTLNVFNFIDSFIMLWPIIILYYIKVGGSVASSGILLSILTMSSAVLEVPLGAFSDKFGRARTTQIGAFSNLVAFSLIAISWYMGFWYLAVGVFFQGLGSAAYSGNNEALLYDSSRHLDKEYIEHLADYSKLAFYSSGISAILGGVIASKSFFIVALLSLAPRLICFFLSLKLKEVDDINTEDDYFKIISKGVKAMHSSDSLRNLSIGELIRGVSSEIAWQYRAVFVQAIWPVWAIGLSTAANNIICGMATSKSKLIIKRLGGVYKSVYRGLLLSRLIQIIAVAWANVLSPLTIGLSSIFDSTSNLAIDSEKQNLMPDKQRATISSLNSFISSITFSIVIIPTSKAIDVLGINISLIMFFVISLLSLPFYLKAFKGLKKANT